MGIVLRQPNFRAVAHQMFQEAKQQRRLEGTLTRIAKRLIRKVQFNINGRILNRITGKLYGGWHYKISGTRDKTVAHIWNDEQYSKIHDTGGMAGRNHATRIPKRSYFRKAVVAVAPSIRKDLRNYLARIGK